jgi:hypothetical protein
MPTIPHAGVAHRRALRRFRRLDSEDERLAHWLVAAVVADREIDMAPLFAASFELTRFR